MSNDNVTVNRKRYVGGSDLPHILGLNEIKYGDSLFDFAKKKMGIIPNDFKGNAYTKYGQLLEPIIREYLNATNGTHYIEDTVIDEELRQRGNTDGIDRNTDFIPMLEVKTFGESGLDLEYYEAQCQFYMERFDQPSIVVAGYKRPDDFFTGIDYDLENGDEFFNLDFDPDRLELHVIERDPVKWQHIQNKITAFQNACEELKKNPEMTLDEWNMLFYGSEIVKRQQEVIKLEEKLMGFKEIEKQHKKAKQLLLEEFEKHHIKTLDTGKIRITHVKTDETTKRVFDESAFKKKHPKLHKQFNTKDKVTKGKSYLLVTVKKLGGE